MEIVALLDKFFPRMEGLETQLRKYKREIGLLQQQVNASRLSVKEQLDTGKLQQEIRFLRQFYADTPDEYKAAYCVSQQSQSSKQQR